MRKKYPARLEVRWPDKLRSWLRAAAEERGITEAQLVRDTIEDMLRTRYPPLEPQTEDA